MNPSRPRPTPYRFRGLLAAATALAAVLCLLLGGSLFGGKVLTQADALYQFAPWKSHAPAGYRPSNELLLDQSTGFLPWMDFQAEQVRRGELPLWNPYNYCGEPLVGTYQSAIYWPFHWLFYLWPSWHTHAWIAFGHLWLAGIFTFLFLRRLGMSIGAACVGGLGYMLSGFMIVWLNHPHVRCALFLPAMLWCVERMMARPRAREAALFGTLFGLQLLAGHIQTSLHLSIFTAAYAGFHVLVGKGTTRLQLRGVIWLAIGGVLGLALAAPQILPFLEYLDHSQAGEVFEKMETVSSKGVSGAAILMLDPYHYGAPHTHDYTGPLGQNLNFNELIGGYVGRVLILLAVIQTAWAGWRRHGTRKATFFFLVVVILSALVAYQVGPFYRFFDSIPHLRSTKLMRVLQFVAFGLAVLGAMGLDRLMQGRPYRRLVTLGAFLLIAGEQLWFARGYNPQVDADILVPRTEVTDFLRREQGLYRSLGVDNTILKPNANVFYRIPMVSGYDSMEDRALADLVLRMTTAPPDFPFISQIGAFNRIDALPLMNLLGIKYFLSEVPLPAPLRKVLDAEVQVYENPDVMPRAFLARGVTVIEDPAARIEHIAGSGFDPWIAVVEHAPPTSPLTAPPGSTDQSDARPEQAEITAYRPRQVDVRVRTSRRAMLVLTDVWDPGWSATAGAADGSGTTGETALPIERVDHALRGVWVGPGDWIIRFRYDPATTRWGVVLAAIAATIMLLLLLRPGRHPPAVGARPPEPASN